MAQQLGSNYYNSPYKFNGKELDEETGLYYYGARYYDPKVSIWLSVDPLGETMPSFSPYNYCRQNPINRIDPDGRKDYNFDKDGNFTGVTNDNWWHNLWNGSRGCSVDENGKKTYFNFASGSDDTDLIDRSNKSDVKLHILDGKEIKNILANAGVFRKENQGNNKIDFMLQEGIGGGSLDFASGVLEKYEGTSQASHINPTPVFFLPKGEDTAHNQSNFGNFLIGAAAQALKVPPMMMLLGAHYNSVFNENGYKDGGQLDSQDDQDSIGMGYRYGVKILSKINIKNTQQGPIVIKKHPNKKER